MPAEPYHHDSPPVARLVARGVCIPNPASVEIGAEVDPERIAARGVTIHPGCRIHGATTLIMAGSAVGADGPVTLRDCQLGPSVQLRGGSFQQTVLLKGASVGPCAHVREGTILEERASAAHSVGLKQTILFPFVTLGSLINFCDILMTGGSGPRQHSEVGSSYIHFNFTPSQDKATASLLGDVPRGVMLDQPPIFLGGQGGLVGPCRLAFGTTVAAGTICRKDELRPGYLIFGGAQSKGGSIPFTPGIFRGIRRIVLNNIHYVAQLIALGQWCRHARNALASSEMPPLLIEALRHNLRAAIDERLKRLGDFIERLEGIPSPHPVAGRESGSADNSRGGDLRRGWQRSRDALCSSMEHPGEVALRDLFLESLERTKGLTGNDYLAVILALPAAARETGTAWLEGIVRHIDETAVAHLPTMTTSGE